MIRKKDFVPRKTAIFSGLHIARKLLSVYIIYCIKLKFGLKIDVEEALLWVALGLYYPPVGWQSVA